MVSALGWTSFLDIDDSVLNVVCLFFTILFMQLKSDEEEFLKSYTLGLMSSLLLKPHEILLSSQMRVSAFIFHF